MQIAIVILLSLVNIILWVIMLIKFKKLFSTDKIIEKARDEMNHMITDIDRTTNRNLTLTQEAENRIRDKINESDKEFAQLISKYTEASNRLRNMLSEADKYGFKKGFEAATESRSGHYNESRTDSKNLYESVGRKFNSINDNPVTYRPEPSMELFNTSKEPPSRIYADDNMVVTDDGAAYKEIPLIITKVLDEKPVTESTETQTFEPSRNPISRNSGKNNLSSSVRKLYEMGYNINQIATELSCSLTEVQLIIDML